MRSGFSLPATARFPRTVVGSFLPRAMPALVAVACLATAYLVLARSCEYDHWAIIRYLGYVGFFVWLPGATLLSIVQRKSVNIASLVAVGLPVGFALEILTFLGLSSLHLRGLYPLVPLGWLGALLLTRPWEGGEWLANLRGRARPTWIGAALSALVLAVILTAASHLFAPSPLFNGKLLEVTHHDWIYLLSRASEIKQRWPLEDPSLAGSRMSYHYFLMVHIAASSLTTGNELSLIMLRLVVLPLNIVLLAQVYWLGKLLTKRTWGGIIAASLLLILDEVSFEASSDSTTFLNLFVHWLYISPTFFFGIIFMGALILWVHSLNAREHVRWPELGLLFLLSSAATGAKGTVVPPLIVALSAWTFWEALETHRLSRKKLSILFAMSAGFCLIYFSILRDWGTGSAVVAPFAAFQIARFWLDHVVNWQHTLIDHGISAWPSMICAQLGCAAVLMLGFHGVRSLGVYYIFRPKTHEEPALARWLGLTYFSYLLFGLLLSLDSYSQLYLFFPIKFPSAVLASAAVFRLGIGLNRRLGLTLASAHLVGRALSLPLLSLVCGILIWREEISLLLGFGVFVLGLFLLPVPMPFRDSLDASSSRKKWLKATAWTLPYLALGAVGFVQLNHWALRNRQGLQLWAITSARGKDEDLTLLSDGMKWLRTQTKPNAIIVANAFTTRNMKVGNRASLDRTTVDKYYYYSALAERRFWVEGPSYLKDQGEAQRRMELADRIFYGSLPRSALPELSDSYYLLVDYRLGDGARADLSAFDQVFRNDRLSIFRVVSPASVARVGEGAKARLGNVPGDSAGTLNPTRPVSVQ